MNKIMDKVNNWLEEKFVPVATRVASVRYMIAIKNAFYSAIPFIMVGSIFVVIAFLAIPGWDKIVEPFLPMLYAGMGYTNDLLSVWIAAAYGYHLADYYGLDPLLGAFSSVMGFFISAATIVDGSLSMANMGGNGIFTAILIGTFCIEVYRFCVKHNITIRMPESVPPKIASSFTMIIPILIQSVVLIFITVGLHFDITSWVMDLFKPLVTVGDSLPAMLFIAFLVSLLFYVGIHGWAVVLSVIGPIGLANIEANAAAVAAGETMLPHVLTEQFFDAWGCVGGSTMAGCLVFWLFFCKSKQLKEAAKLSVIPSLLCNVHEPVMYGVPTVLNPYFFIPVVFSMPLCALTTWLAMNWGWVMKPFVYVSWSTPEPFYPWLTTGGDWRSLILLAVNVVLVLILYYPFVKAYDKVCLKQEQETLANKGLTE